nr:TadE family protein [Arthrobacter zhangbolii]
MPAGGTERGSAVVDFVLVGALVGLVFMAVIQLALVLHVRNTLIDAAATGDRYGTLADRSPGLIGPDGGIEVAGHAAWR